MGNWAKYLPENKINPQTAMNSINKMSKEVNMVKVSLEKTNTTLNSKRIPASLERFDNRFHFFLSSQNLRWLIIELLLPIFIWGYSTFLLSKELLS